MTRQGYDALTQPLRWSDLELIKKTDRYAPADDYTAGGLGAPGRSGRRVVHTIWRASHMDQAFFSCGGLNFR